MSGRFLHWLDGEEELLEHLADGAELPDASREERKHLVSGLKDEVDHALSSAPRRGKEHPRVCVQTFGNFDLKVDGKTVLFGRSKAKELLAYLVDRQGSSITRAEVATIMVRMVEPAARKRFTMD